MGEGGKVRVCRVEVVYSRAREKFLWIVYRFDPVTYPKMMFLDIRKEGLNIE